MNRFARRRCEIFLGIAQEMARTAAMDCDRFSQGSWEEQGAVLYQWRWLPCRLQEPG